MNIGVCSNGIFEARGPNDPWQYVSQYYVLFKSHDKQFQAPRVRCVYFHTEERKWMFECEQITFIATDIVTGFILLDSNGETIADYDLKTLKCFVSGDSLRLTIGLFTGREMALEDAVEMYRKGEHEDPSVRTPKEGWKRYCGGIRHDVSEIKQQGEESYEGRICR